ncbi:hypothetical protein NMY22_g17900 [Coprinellus aureogranulatus]|nr:hypothetical protein NMY22_g17900 [Coprinellus aureogranulatus]
MSFLNQYPSRIPARPWRIPPNVKLHPDSLTLASKADIQQIFDDPALGMERAFATGWNAFTQQFVDVFQIYIRKHIADIQDALRALPPGQVPYTTEISVFPGPDGTWDEPRHEVNQVPLSSVVCREGEAIKFKMEDFQEMMNQAEVYVV